MIKLSKISEFHKSYQFFIIQPSRAISVFILTLLGIVILLVSWASIMKMDNVIKANALLRPSGAISIIKALPGGEVLKKSYKNDSFVDKGDLLLQFDTEADFLELENSEKLMKRINNNIVINKFLQETIRKEKNSVSIDNEEAFIRSEAYIIEFHRLSGHIKKLKINLEREKSLPKSISIKQNFEDAQLELSQTKLQFSLWKKQQMINTMNEFQNLTLRKENLERRISDLERYIRNATIYAPISGRINELRKLNVGDKVLTGEEIFTIVPNDSRSLKAELYIEPAYIAQVEVGQKVSLLFPGLPPSKFGKLEAEITLIPADYSEGIDSEPVFIVEAHIENPWLLSPNDKKIYLRSGISAIGRVIINQDTVMRMILKKIDFISESYEVKSLSK